MKDSSEWVRQNRVDKAANEELAARGCSIAEMKPYWVAKRLGVDPSGEIYDKVYDWQRRMEAEHAVSTVEVPIEAEAALRHALEHLTAEVMAVFTRAVRSAGGAIDHAAGLRVADAELRASRATSARIDVLALCRQAESDRDDAREQVDALETALAEAGRREERLIGRLEQRELDTTGKDGPVAGDTEPVPIDASDGDAGKAADDQPKTPDLPAEIVSGPDMLLSIGAEAGAPKAAAPFKEQPPAIASDPREGGQAEMPLDTGNNDGTSHDAGADRG